MKQKFMDKTNIPATPVKMPGDLERAIDGSSLDLIDQVFDTIHMPKDLREYFCQEIVDCGVPVQTILCARVISIKTSRFGTTTVRLQGGGFDVFLVDDLISADQLEEIRRAMSDDLRLRVEFYAKPGPTGSFFDFTVINKDDSDCVV